MQGIGNDGDNNSRRAGSSAAYGAMAPTQVTSGGGFTYAMHQHQFGDHGNSSTTTNGSLPRFEYASRRLPPVVHSGDQRPQHHHLNMHYRGQGHGDGGNMNMPPPPPGYVLVPGQPVEAFVASSAPHGTTTVSGKASPTLPKLVVAAVTPDTQSNPQSKHHHLANNEQQQHSSIYHQNHAHNLHYFSNQTMHRHHNEQPQEYSQRTQNGLQSDGRGADNTPSRGQGVGSHASSHYSPVPSSSHVPGESQGMEYLFP